MDDKLKDIIVANSLDELPEESSFAKERIVGYLKTMHKDNPKFWMSRKTIAEESKVGAVYTCHVLDNLLQRRLSACAYPKRMEGSTAIWAEHILKIGLIFINRKTRKSTRLKGGRSTEKYTVRGV